MVALVKGIFGGKKGIESWKLPFFQLLMTVFCRRMTMVALGTGVFCGRNGVES